MKTSEILLEYQRSATKEKYLDRIIKHLSWGWDTRFTANTENLSDDERIELFLERIEFMDPTANNKYTLWLLNRWLNSEFRIEDGARIQNTLSDFDQMKPYMRRQGLSTDINQYTLYSLEDLISSLSNTELNANTESKRREYENYADMKVLYSGSLGELIVPLTMAASCEIGRGTRWCTAADNDNMFAEYSQDGYLYVWIDKSGKKYQFHWESNQFMDAADRPLDAKTMKFFRQEHPVLSKLFAEREKSIIDNWRIWDLVRYAEKVVGGRWPLLEQKLIAMITDRTLDRNEKLTILDYVNSYTYGTKERWPELESALAQEPALAYSYSYRVLNRDTRKRRQPPIRWPEAEENIKKDPWFARLYATDIINQHDPKPPVRWQEAEEYIMKNPSEAVEYAEDVLKTRWLEAEPYISLSKTAAEEYAQYFRINIDELRRNPYNGQN